MRPQKVIRTYLLVSGLYTLSASLIWGVNTLFLLDAGLDILGVFIANGVFTGSMALFEIPTGIVADARGRRLSFLLSLVIVLVGTLGYVWAAAAGGRLALFIAASIILGLGYTFYSGAVEAWLVDALNASRFEGQLDGVFARGSMVTGCAMLIGTVTGGFLGSVQLSLPFLVRSGLLVVVFGVAFVAMQDLGFTPADPGKRSTLGRMKRIAQTSLSLGWGERRMRLLISTGAAQSVFLAWGFHAWQPHFLGLLCDPQAVQIAALLALAGIAGNGVVEWFTRYCGRRTTLLLWAAGIQTLAAVGVGLVGSFYTAVALYLVVMAAAGVMMPVKQAYLHQLIPSEQRATVVSFDSLVSSAASMGGQGGLGYLSRIRGIADGYVVGGALTIVALPLLALLRRAGTDADVIRGRGGVQGGSACDGLPEVSGVDTRRRVEPAEVSDSQDR